MIHSNSVVSTGNVLLCSRILKQTGAAVKLLEKA